MAPSRHEKFLVAFKQFFDELSEHHYHDLRSYTLESFTINKTCRDHEYVLTIPRNVLSYTIRSNDPTIQNEENYTKQSVPTATEMKMHVYNRFNKDSLIINGTVMSFVDIVNICFTNNDEINGDFKAKIEVCYYKSHIPFEVERTPMEKMTIEINNLKETVIELNDNLSIISDMYADKCAESDANRRERIAAKERYYNLQERMMKKLVGLYKNLAIKEDCPICYEAIDASKLKIPACCHFICKSCADRCSPQQCPLCRVAFV